MQNKCYRFTHARVVFYVITQNTCVENAESLPPEIGLFWVEWEQEKGTEIAETYS